MRETDSAPRLQSRRGICVLARSVGHLAPVWVGAAVDTPLPIVVSFQLFEGEKSVGSPAVHLTAGGCSVEGCVQDDKIGQTEIVIGIMTEAGQVNVVHVSSHKRNRKFLTERRDTGARPRGNHVAHSLFVFYTGLFPVPLARH